MISGPKIGDAFPTAKLVKQDGGDFKMGASKAKPTMVLFYASWNPYIAEATVPVLKEVGVVDSGGQGLVCVYEGFLAELTGEELPDVTEIAPSIDELVNAQHHHDLSDCCRTSWVFDETDNGAQSCSAVQHRVYGCVGMHVRSRFPV